jgi:hypothetical protein
MPKKPYIVEKVSLSEIFPWLKKETDKEHKARMKKRDAMRKKHQMARTKAYCFIDQRTTATEKHLHYEDLLNPDQKYPGIRDARFWYVFSDFILFIDSADLDKVQRKAYEKWLIGQTRPVIPGVESASYFSDYHRFYDAFIEGRTATIND